MAWTGHSAAHTECRVAGHAWFRVNGSWTPKWGVPLTWSCNRCDMERRWAVNQNSGEVVYRRYVPAPGYYLSKEEERPSRDELRLFYIEDQIKEMREANKAVVRDKRRKTA